MPLFSSDFWGLLLTLVVMVAPLSLAWLLLGRDERRKGPAGPATDGDNVRRR